MTFSRKVMAAVAGAREIAIRKAAAAMDPNTKFDRKFCDKQASKVGLFSHKKFELQYKMDSGSSFVYEVISDIRKRGSAGITVVQVVFTPSSKPGYSDATVYNGEKSVGKTDNMAMVARTIDSVLAAEYSAYEPAFSETKRPAGKEAEKVAASTGAAGRKALAVRYGTYRDADEMNDKVREIYDVLKNGGRRHDSNDFGHEIKTCVEYMDRMLEKYWGEHGKDSGKGLEDTLMEMWEWGKEWGSTADMIYADLKKAYKVCKENDKLIYAGDSDAQGAAFIEWACSTRSAALQNLKEWYEGHDDEILESVISLYKDETGKKIRMADAEKAVNAFGYYNFQDDNEVEASAKRPARRTHASAYRPRRKVVAAAKRDVQCTIKWNDDGSEEDVTIRIDPKLCDGSLPEDDGSIFFYCKSEDEFEKLKKEGNGEDFVVTSSAKRAVKAGSDSWRYKMVLLDGIKVPVYFNGDTSELYEVFKLLSDKDKKDIAAAHRREGGEILVHGTEGDPAEREVSVVVPSAQDPSYSYDWKVKLEGPSETTASARRAHAAAIAGRVRALKGRRQ